jgi:uncharacterized protein YkwD
MKRGAGSAARTMVIIAAVILSNGNGQAARAAGRKAKMRGARVARCVGAYARPTRRTLARALAATLCLIEQERGSHHAGSLHTNGYLQSMAGGQASDMVRGDYFGDNSLTGRTPWQRITASRYGRGARGLAAGQNIGWGTGRLATPAAMVAEWMRSAPHRQIMLSGQYRDVGVGIAPAAPRRLAGGRHGATYAIVFAARG